MYKIINVNTNNPAPTKKFHNIVEAAAEAERLNKMFGKSKFFVRKKLK